MTAWAAGSLSGIGATRRSRRTTANTRQLDLQQTINFRTVTLGVQGRVVCGDGWETRGHGGSERWHGSGCLAGAAVGCGAVVRRRAAGLCGAGRRGVEGAGGALLL